ncbi:hypothetical protein ACLB2K_069978 [Fragaria x ananassa]
MTDPSTSPDDDPTLFTPLPVERENKRENTWSESHRTPTPVTGRRTPVTGRRTPVTGRRTPVTGRRTPVTGIFPTA